jgi:hypothetical protein
VSFIPGYRDCLPGICAFGVYVFGGDAAMFYLLLGIATLSISYHRRKRGELIAMIGWGKAKDGVLWEKGWE